MKVLFVTRDKKPGMIATRIARVLQAESAAIRVVAEGLSVAEWNGAGFDNCLVAEGPLDIKTPWDINPDEMLKMINPDVLVTGLSSPIRMEERFVKAMAMTNLNKPVVALDDNWGAIHRCKHSVDLVLTIDELGKKLVSQCLAYAHHNYKVEIIGDLSATAAQEPIPQATIDAFNKAKGDAEYAFILASQKWPESGDIVEIGLASCALSLKAGARLVVIPRFHPGAKPEDRERWNQMVAQFSEEFPDAVKILGDQSINTDHLATLADGVFAATGSALRAAAYAGKISLCIWTSRIAKKLLFECGIERHPLVAATVAGCCEMRTPRSIINLVRMLSRDTRPRQELLVPIPFDAEKAANAILAIANK